MVVLEVKFIQLIVECMKRRKLETCGIGRFEKKGKDYYVSDFQFAEYMGEKHPMMDGWELATGSSTYVNPSILHKYNTSKIANVHWHSHSNLPVFWSGTDESLIKKWQTQELLSIVTNNNNEILIRFDKAFLSGIETQTLFRGKLSELEVFGERLTKKERKDFGEICPMQTSSLDKHQYSRQAYRQSRLSEQEELDLLPYFL